MKIPILARLLCGLVISSLAGCSCGQRDGALLVVVNVDATVRGSCVVLEVSAPGAVTVTQDLVRAPGKDSFRIGLKQAQLPSAVTLTARTFTPRAGEGCKEPRVLTSASAPVDAVFPRSGLDTATLAIHAPGLDLDADGDSHVDLAKGGDDCDDSDAATNPGVAEVCLDGVDRNCNGLAGCADPACQAQPCTTAPSQLAFITAVQTVAQNACSGAVTLQAQDATGAAILLKAALPVAIGITPAGAAQVFADSTCSTPLLTPAVSANQSTLTYYFKAPAAGLVTFAATAAGVAGTSQTETITAPATATQLAITSPQQTVAEGSCSQAVVIELRDASSTPVPAVVATTIILTANPGAGFSFFSDSACGTSASSVIVNPGASSATVYFNATNLGSVNVTAASGVLTAALQTETIAAGAASKLVFTSGPQSVSAGACSAIVTLETRDTAGNAAPVAEVTMVMLAALNGVIPFSDPGCVNAVGSVAVASGSSTASFYFQGPTPGSSDLTASSAGLTPVTQTETITPAGASVLAIISAAQTRVAGVCSSPMTLQVKDSLGNNTPVSAAATVTLGASPSGMTFFSDSGCTTLVTTVTIPAGTGTSSFFFKGANSGSITVGASATGLATGAQLETITPAAATVLAFTSTAQSVVAGSCSAPIGMQTRDAFGNVSPVGVDRTILVASTGVAGFAFYSDATCGTVASSIVIATGTSTGTFYFKSTGTGTAVMTASGPFPNITQTAMIAAGTGTKLAITSAAQNSVVAGACSAALTVQSQDLSGNPAPVTAATIVNLASNAAGGFAFSTDSGCTTSATTLTLSVGSSSGTFYFRAKLAGPVVVSVSATGYSGENQIETVVAAAAAKLSFTSAAQTVQSIVCSTGVTVEIEDSFGNPKSVAVSTTVNLASSAASGFTFYAGGTCGGPSVTSVPIAAGSSSVVLSFKGTLSGSTTIWAASGLLTPASQVETISGGPMTKIAFATNPQTLAAGVCSQVATVAPQDAVSNATTFVGAGTLQLTVSPVTIAPFVFYSNPTCTIAVTSLPVTAGSSAVNFYFNGFRTPGYAMTATLTGYVAITQPVVTTPAAPFALAFANAPLTTVPSGGCSAALTVQVNDKYGNPSPVGAAKTVTVSGSPTVSLFSDSGCTTPLGGLQINSGASATVQFYLVGPAALGADTLTAVATGLISGTQLETVVAGPPAKLGYLTVAVPLSVNTCSGLLTVQTQDVSGNPTNVLADATVTLAGQGGSGIFFFASADAACATPIFSVLIANGGNSQSFRIKTSTAGSWSVTASSGVLTPGVQLETLNPESATKLVFGNAGLTVSAGSCSPALVVVTEDGSNNVSNLTAATTVTMTFSSGSVTAYSDSACTTAAASVVIPNGGSTATFYFKTTVSGTFTATATATGLAPTPAQTETVTALAPGKVKIISGVQTLVSGACSAVVNLVTQDGYGNTSAMTALQGALTVTPTGPGFSVFSDSTCLTTAPTVTIGVGGSTGSFYFKPSTPVGSLILTAAADLGLTGDTQTEAISAGPATQLGFTTGALTATAGQCSGPVTIGLLDAAGNAAAAPTPVTITVSSSVAPTPAQPWYSNPTCTTQLASGAKNQLTINAGTSSGSFYFNITAATTYPLTVSAPTFNSPTQAEVVIAAAPLTTVISPATVSLLASACSPANTITIRDTYGNNANGPFTVNLSSTAPSQTFYSDATCATAVASVNVLIGSSTVTFYWKVLTGGAATVTASGGGTQTDTITNTVRTGSCAMANSTQTCTFTPAVTDVTRTFFFFQATHSTGDAVNSDVRCELDTVGKSALLCSRQTSGGTANLTFQIIEYPAGVTVQHVPVVACLATQSGSTWTQNVPIGAVTTGESFVLVSSERSSTGHLFRTAKLNANSVDIVYSAATNPCSGVTDNTSLVVVDLTGASVTSGTISITPTNPTSTQNFGGVAVDLTRSFLLYSWRVATLTGDACNSMIRGELNDGQHALFSRGAGSGDPKCTASLIDEIAFQRVVLPAGNLVQPLTLSITGGGTTVASPNFGTTVDVTRSAAFAGGQWAAGQVNGEGDLTGSTQVGPMRANHAITSTQLGLLRPSGGSVGKWTSYVIQFQP